MSTFLQTFTGKPFYPLNPTQDSIDLVDIAHALGMVCRYGGHSRRFYSVAEHCVILSHTVGPEHALWALLHDATEAYVGDMVWPLKEEIPIYRGIEERLMLLICDKYELPWPMPAQVKEHDRRIVIDERDALMAVPQAPWLALEGFAPLGVEIEGWSPERAEAEYLNRFTEIKEHRNG